MSDVPLAARMRDLADDLLAMIDGGGVEALDDEAIGRLYAAVVRLHAERAQRAGAAAPPFAGNVTVSATDVMIGCSAMLEAARLEVFELSVWQNMTSIRPTAREARS